MSYIKNMPHARAHPPESQAAAPAPSESRRTRLVDAVKGLPSTRIAIGALAAAALASGAYAAREYLSADKPAKSGKRKSGGRSSAKRRAAA